MPDYKKELKDFSYIVSHDLNAPVRHIKQFGQMLANSLGDNLNQQQKEYLGYMTNAADKMEAMLEAIMTYSRLNTTEQDINAVDFNTAVEYALAKQETSNAQITIDPLPKDIAADQSQIHRLFDYLLDNSFKFKKADEIVKIKITCEDQQDHWLFCIQDNGIGLNSEDPERLFTIFNREHSDQAYSGIGAGLTFAKKIIDLHNGTIWIENNDDGALVSFTLPK